MTTACRRRRSAGFAHRRWTRTQAWLWTGPLGHFLGGALDVLAALARHRLARTRGRIPALGSRSRVGASR